MRSHGPGASHLDGRLEETAHAGHKAVNRGVGVRPRSCSASLRPTNRLPKILTLDFPAKVRDAQMPTIQSEVRMSPNVPRNDERFGFALDLSRFGPSIRSI